MVFNRRGREEKAQSTQFNHRASNLTTEKTELRHKGHKATF